MRQELEVRNIAQKEFKMAMVKRHSKDMGTSGTRFKKPRSKGNSKEGTPSGSLSGSPRIGKDPSPSLSPHMVVRDRKLSRDKGRTSKRDSRCSQLGIPIVEEEGSSASDADSDIESDEELTKVEAAQVAMKKAADEINIPARRRGASQQGFSWSLQQPTPPASSPNWPAAAASTVPGYSHH